jgi:phosphatidylglycerol lysyltransferase
MLQKSKNKSGPGSYKTYWRELLAVVMLLLAIVFFRSERKELHAIIPEISRANPLWLTAALLLTLLYFLLQAGIYRKSFLSIGLTLHWGDAIMLFLKRNFISVFLPAGGISSLTYSPSQIRKSGFTQTQVHQASGLFAFASLLTVFIAGIPVVLFTVFHIGGLQNAWLGLFALLLILAGLFAGVNSIRQKRKLYRWIETKFPSIIPVLNELFDANVSTAAFGGAILYSLMVELCGILHVYIAMMALGLHASFGASASAYIIAVLLMIVSPFLRGLGAVEPALTRDLAWKWGRFAERATGTIPRDHRALVDPQWDVALWSVARNRRRWRS